jgi:hypothetical protein
MCVKESTFLIQTNIPPPFSFFENGGGQGRGYTGNPSNFMIFNAFVVGLAPGRMR